MATTNSTLPEHCFNDTVLDAILQFDGDIAGLGVRLSFYFQTFILVLLVDRSPEDAPSSLWTLTITSCGLTVAAIVQVASQSLNLLEAILVAQLVWLANVACFIASASYSRTQSKDSLVKFAHVGQGYFSMILTIVMWRYADKLGQFPECNALVKFVVVFGVECEAVTVGRTIALVFASVTLGAYTYLTLKELQAWWHQRRKAKRKGTHPRERKRHGPKKRARNKVHQRNKWLPIDVDAKLVGVVLCQLIIFAYFLSTTEFIIAKTGRWQVANHTWGFGQVFALMVITPSFIALCRSVHANRMAGRWRDKHRAAEEGRAGHTGRPSIELPTVASNGPDQSLRPPNPRSPGGASVSGSSMRTDNSSMHSS